MKTREKTARAVHANRGIEAAYRRRLRALVDEMQASIDYWLPIAYRANPPRMAAVVEQAQDAKPGQASKAGQEWSSRRSPTAQVRKVLGDLRERWITKFDEAAPKIAETYVKEMFKASDSAMRRSLKDAGWAVEFEMTPAVRDAFNASLQENIALIKSIPQQYLTQTEGVVMRSYAAGRDLETMVKALKALYPPASHRAELIARDQSNKANAVVNRTRQLELGITEAMWMHSHAGKTPRPDHLKADRTRYKIAEGCKISGEFIQPGEEINCRCTSRPILPF